eukprot:CAMPEP_0185572314 /NCGR_PEP_ID=MMETSP0434-20130131/4270_1 /TAXON_ID=626734 ORGANISM="Favella taraikaensis, Strain Fe Narragansett Bay" /NCGR_SAMPLE_ID=MMETSP0434 /ASSEMBLY_ACC=CAM_ASM_000379 /LENGTH=221 /DNA_ID=CAMNT_0028188149 /DNA_START=247 /DNA_END=913 /DNA_ORIENTATION=-
MVVVILFLGSAVGSAHLEVVIDLARLAEGVEGHVGAGAVGSSHLDVNVRQVVHRQGLALGSIELRLGLADSLSEALAILLVTSSRGLIVQILQERVVFVVCGQLERVLVVGEESVVSIGQVSEGAAEEEGVLDGGLVVHGAEVVLADGQDHQLLEEAIAHHELLGGAGDVSVVVEDAHAGEASDLHLEGNVGGQIRVNHSLASGVRTHVASAGEDSAEDYG